LVLPDAVGLVEVSLEKEDHEFIYYNQALEDSLEEVVFTSISHRFHTLIFLVHLEQPVNFLIEHLFHLLI
jgi:hypothetical protein